MTWGHVFVTAPAFLIVSSGKTTFSFIIQYFYIDFTNLLPWKSRVLARVQFDFAQWVTLETSNILTPWLPKTQNINQSHQCIWRRWAKSVAVLPIGYGKSYLLVSSAGLDTSPLVFFWLVVLLSNCVQWYFQMHAWGRPSSWAIFLTRCQTLQLSSCGSGFPGYYYYCLYVQKKPEEPL